MRHIIWIAILLTCGRVIGAEGTVTLSTVVGAVYTIKDAIIGDTTIASACNLYKYDWWDKTTRDFPAAPIFGMEDYNYPKEYRYVSMTHFRVKSITFTGTFLFSYTNFEPVYNKKTNRWERKDYSYFVPFDIETLARIDCDWWQEGVWKHSVLADFSVRVWINSVVSTGLKPASGPFETFVLMSAKPACGNGGWRSTRERGFREAFYPDVGRSVTGKIGWVGYSYGPWPPFVWNGEFFEHQPGD